MTHARLYLAESLAASAVSAELHTPGADVEHVVVDVLGITDARELKRLAYVTPTERSTRDFVLVFSAMTTEAQNALLKLLEEPPPATVFHLVTTREDVLIPTLRSRLERVAMAGTAIDPTVFAQFKSLAAGERLQEIARRAKAKDLAWMETLLAGAETEISKETPRQSDLLASLVLIRQYFGSRGSSAKMLLEELALSLP